jgi:hypothetical protein
VRRLEAGNTYVNVRAPKNPGGEIASAEGELTRKAAERSAAGFI